MSNYCATQARGPVRDLRHIGQGQRLETSPKAEHTDCRLLSRSSSFLLPAQEVRRPESEVDKGKTKEQLDDGIPFPFTAPHCTFFLSPPPILLAPFGL